MKIKTKKKQEPRLEVTCSSCGDEFMMDETAVRKRPCAGEEWIDEYGLVCPHCEYWQHVRLNTPELQKIYDFRSRKTAVRDGMIDDAKVEIEKLKAVNLDKMASKQRISKQRKETQGAYDNLMRAERAVKKADRKYLAAYKMFHAEWRPKLGLIAPGELLTDDMIGGDE